MIETFFNLLDAADSFFWGYVAFALIVVLGTILTFQSRFFQLLKLPSFIKLFFKSFGNKEEKARGVSPIRAFFASTGGMIGLGNVVSVVIAVQLGGPGALIWVWIAALLGAIVKYSEIYLGFKYRVENKEGSYDGGPMYFLKKAFKWRFIPIAVAALLCVYGVDVYQFSVITDSVSSNWHIPHLLVVGLLLGFVLYASLGGVRRIGKICVWIMPFFLVTYALMAFWVIFHEAHLLLPTLAVAFKAAFTGHAAVGGFVGSSLILTIQHGLARSAYSADIGIGYDSIIQSESNVASPATQAKLSIVGVFVDNFICTLSVLLVLLTGVWKSLEPLEGSQMVQVALSKYFPYMHFFMPFFFVVVGYTTLIAFFCVGLKCAKYLFGAKGRKIYLVYGVVSMTAFSYLPQMHAMTVMSVSGALLLIINLVGIFRLRHEIHFDEEPLPISEVA